MSKAPPSRGGAFTDSYIPVYFLYSTNDRVIIYTADSRYKRGRNGKRKAKYEGHAAVPPRRKEREFSSPSHEITSELFKNRVTQKSERFKRT